MKTNHTTHQQPHRYTHYTSSNTKTTTRLPKLIFCFEEGVSRHNKQHWFFQNHHPTRHVLPENTQCHSNWHPIPSRWQSQSKAPWFRPFPQQRCTVAIHHGIVAKSTRIQYGTATKQPLDCCIDHSYHKRNRTKTRQNNKKIISRNNHNDIMPNSRHPLSMPIPARQHGDSRVKHQPRLQWDILSRSTQKNHREKEKANNFWIIIIDC